MESSREDRLAADTALATAVVTELEAQTPVSFHRPGLYQGDPWDLIR